MRCPTCEGEIDDGATRCPSCGETRGAVCAECGTVGDPEARICGACGCTLRSPALGAPPSFAPPIFPGEGLAPPPAVTGEAKPVTVLFLDVQDSMTLAGRLGPERWHALLDRFFRVVTAAIGRFGGTVNQFTGDGVMALFGAPVAQEDHARRACEAALAMRRELRLFALATRAELRVDVHVRIGINSGDVVVGHIGDDRRHDYTAQGQCVGLAERMQRIAPADEAVITDRTAELVDGFFELESLGLVDAKGAGERVRAHRLVATRSGATRLERSVRRGLSRFVGREQEVGNLEVWAGAVRAGRGQIIGVVGAAGVGKSRLCQEFAASRRERGWNVCEAHGLAHRREVPGLAALELVRSLVHADGDDTAARAEDLDPAITGLLGTRADGEDGATAGPEHVARSLARILPELVRERSRRCPLLVLLDDAHWMDAVSLGVIEDLIAAAATSAALVLINFRPEFTPPGSRRSDYQQIALRPLDEDATEEIVAELLGRDPSLGALPGHLRERAAGNPFFLEELVRTLVEAGLLTGERGGRQMPQPIDVLAVPTDVRALLAARLDRLGELEKQVVEAAAVIGRRFSATLLARVAAISPEEADRALSALERAEILRDDGGDERSFGFEHPLVQGVAYQSQLADRRRRAHAAVARALQEIFADRLGETAAIVAHHLEAAGDLSAASRWQRRAALRVTRIQPRREV
jgi:class 3 adenylate cyclase